MLKDIIKAENDITNYAILIIGNEIENSYKSYVIHHKKKQRVEIANKKNIYFLAKGSACMYSSENGLIIKNFFAPVIINLENIKQLNIDFFIRCNSDVTMHVMSNQDTVELFDTKKLWSFAFDILSRNLKVCYLRDKFIRQPTTRDTIIEYIKYIWAFDEQQRNSISLYNYIMSRTYISRSSIHKIFSELERKGFITLRRGVLVKSNFTHLTNQSIK